MLYVLDYLFPVSQYLPHHGIPCLMSNAEGLFEGSTGIIDDANKVMRAVVRGARDLSPHVGCMGLGKALESTMF